MAPRTTVYEHTLTLLVNPLINEVRLFSVFAVTIKVMVTSSPNLGELLRAQPWGVFLTMELLLFSSYSEL